MFMHFGQIKKPSLKESAFLETISSIPLMLEQKLRSILYAKETLHALFAFQRMMQCAKEEI